MAKYKRFECDHEFTDYHDSGECEGTPYCTWEEKRCKKCKKYFRDCGCHFHYEESGEPLKRIRKRQWKRRQNKYKTN